MSLADIGSRDDLAELIEDFYTRAFADPLIGPVFTEVAHLDLQAHLPIMCDFWESALFQAGNYRRNAFLVHRALHVQDPLTESRFARWLLLWCTVVDERHVGPVAERAKTMAERIAGSMSRRLNPLQARLDSPPSTAST